MPNPLTVEEKQLQQATVAGDWEIYQKLFEAYKKSHSGKIPLEKLLQIFILGEEGGVLLSLSKKVSSTDFAKDEPKAKVLTHLLRELKYANLGNLFHLIQALSDFKLEKADNVNNLLKKTFSSLRKAQDRKALAAVLISYCLEKWETDLVATNDIQRSFFEKKEEIFVFLMNEGADVYEYRYLRYLIQHDLKSALKHKAVEHQFSHLPVSEQKRILGESKDWLKSDIFEMFIQYSSQEARNLLKVKFTEFLSNYLNFAVGNAGLVALRADPVRNAEFEKRMAICGVLLKFDLVEGLDSSTAKLDQEFLAFKDPKTKKPYQLLKFINDIPALKAGWEASKKRANKYKRTKEQYEIVKATLATPGSEIRSEVELEAAKKTPESKLEGKYAYNLIEIQQFLKENPVVTEHVTKALGLNSTLPSIARKHKEKAIVAAAKRNEWDLVEKLIVANVDVNVVDEFGRTALHYAASAGSSDVLEHLLDAGATVESRDKEDKTPLHYAARAGFVDNIKILLSARAGQFVQDKEGKNPLHYAVIAGKLKAVAALLDHNPHVLDTIDNENKTPLHYAAGGNNVEVLSKLLKAWAKVFAIDKEGKTPLHYAASADSVDAIIILLKAGADVDARDLSGNTPLHDAVNFNSSNRKNIDLIKKLIEAGADIKAENNHNFTLKDYGKHKVNQLLSAVATSGAKSEIPQITKKWISDADFPRLKQLRNQYVECMKAFNAIDRKLMNLHEYLAGIRDDVEGVTYQDRVQGIEKCDEVLLSQLAEIRKIKVQIREIPNLNSAVSGEDSIRRLKLIVGSNSALKNKGEEIYNYANKIWASIERAKRTQSEEAPSFRNPRL